MHKEHRSRVKNRFLAEGLDHFEPHNILELLLFYAVPRQDTNELAHRLINRFGSLADVFDAPFEELVTVSGIKEHAATLIKMIPSLARIYSIEKNKIGESLTNVDAWGKYFVSRYIGIEKEVVFLLLLDNKFSVIDCVKLHDGDVNSASFSVRKMVEVIYAKNAPMVVIAHNHPSGLAIPSSDDLSTTQALLHSFRILDIKLLAHIVVAGDRYIDIMDPKNKIKFNSYRLE